MSVLYERCNPALHEQYNGACYFCCDYCNYDRHTCHFCGDSLMHGDVDHGTREKHGCYAKCECGHIGHEHFSDSCRGGEYGEVSRLTDCSCTEFRPAP